MLLNLRVFFPFRQFADLPGHDIVVALVAASRTRLAGRDIAGDLALGNSPAFGIILRLPCRQVFIHPVLVASPLPFPAGLGAGIQQNLVDAAQDRLGAGKIPFAFFFESAPSGKFRIPLKFAFETGIPGLAGSFPSRRIPIFPFLIRKVEIFREISLQGRRVGGLRGWSVFPGLFRRRNRRILRFGIVGRWLSLPRLGLIRNQSYGGLRPGARAQGKRRICRITGTAKRCQQHH